MDKVLRFFILLLNFCTASNINELNFACVPCVSFGGYYCYDDPWITQFNGDKCYEYKVDKVECEGTKFSGEIANCSDNTSFMLKESAQCNITAEEFRKWVLPLELEIDLEPRSSCGFSLFAYSAEMMIEHKYPIIMMHNETGGIVDWQNITSMVWNGVRDTPGDCFSSSCSTTFQIDNSEQYFYFANWDTNKNQTIKFSLIENLSKYYN